MSPAVISDEPNLVDSPNGLVPTDAAPVPTPAVPAPAGPPANPSAAAPNDFSGDVQRIVTSDMDVWQQQKAIREAAESRRKGVISRQVSIPGCRDCSCTISLQTPQPKEAPSGPFAVPIMPVYAQLHVITEARLEDREQLVKVGAECDARIDQARQALQAALDSAKTTPEANSLRALKRQLAAVHKELDGLQARLTSLEGEYSRAVSQDGDYRKVESDIAELTSRHKAALHRLKLLGGGDTKSPQYDRSQAPKLLAAQEAYERVAKELHEKVRSQLMEAAAQKEREAAEKIYKGVLSLAVPVQLARKEQEHLARVQASTLHIPAIEV